MVVVADRGGGPSFLLRYFRLPPIYLLMLDYCTVQSFILPSQRPTRQRLLYLSSATTGPPDRWVLILAATPPSSFIQGPAPWRSPIKMGVRMGQRWRGCVAAAILSVVSIWLSSCLPDCLSVCLLFFTVAAGGQAGTPTPSSNRRLGSRDLEPPNPVLVPVPVRVRPFASFAFPCVDQNSGSLSSFVVPAPLLASDQWQSSNNPRASAGAMYEFGERGPLAARGTGPGNDGSGKVYLYIGTYTVLLVSVC